MRVWPLAVSALLTSILLSSSCVGAEVTDPGGPQYANGMLHSFVTPTIEPGQTLHFIFSLSNPYPSASSDLMVDIVLVMGIYRYATQETSQAVDDGFKNPPLIEGNSTEAAMHLDPMFPGSANDAQISIPITTSKNTPHGSYFSQSTYFVRFNLTFKLAGNNSLVTLWSRGYFSDDQWNTMVSWNEDQQIVNRSYMKSLGVDGIIPDSSFGIKIQIPVWPLAAIIATGAGLCFAAAYHFVLENPGKYPSLEKRFYYLRGKLSELRRKPKNGGGK